MGKSLIIKGADFSANGILDIYDATAIVARHFYPCASLNSFTSTGTANTKRCAVVHFAWSSEGIDISKFRKIELTVKNGFDYVFGTGPKSTSITGWQGWDGTTGGKAFAWVTDSQKAVATVDATTLFMSLNLRYNNNTTEFSSSTVLTDIVDSIRLIP